MPALMTFQMAGFFVAFTNQNLGNELLPRKFGASSCLIRWKQDLIPLLPMTLAPLGHPSIERDLMSTSTDPDNSVNHHRRPAQSGSQKRRIRIRLGDNTGGSLGVDFDDELVRQGFSSGWQFGDDMIDFEVQAWSDSDNTEINGMFNLDWLIQTLLLYYLNNCSSFLSHPKRLYRMIGKQLV